MELTTLVGQILDNQYQIETLLGQGGMGAVYKARHIKLGDVVAIKVMPPHISSNAEYHKRFLREGQAARRFQHPNAITVYDLRETSDGTIYMVLEYIKGHNLREEINKKNNFSPKEALALIEGVASALNEAHKLGVVHRDIKPENIMVNYNDIGKPIVKLLDLGIAKISGVTSLTVAGQILGTPYYMSPEQWGVTDEAKPQQLLEIDGRADIYSLGVILYEMVTGQKPFNGANIQELAVKHITTNPIAAKELNKELPTGFSRAIARALAKERENRPATCQELIDQLNKGLIELNKDEFDTASIGEMTDSLPKKEIADTTPMSREAISILDTEPSNQQDKLDLYITNKISEPLLVDTEPILVSDKSNITQDNIILIKEHKKRRTKYFAICLTIVGTITGIGLSLFNWPEKDNTKLIVNTDNTFAANINKSRTLLPKIVEKKQEILRYWVEVITKNGRSLRRTQNIKLNSEDQLQFHFNSKQPGYLYILMPGKSNSLIAALTTNPTADTRVSTNLLKENIEYQFPGAGKAIGMRNLDKINRFSFIFSSRPITSIPFLNRSTGYELSKEDQQAFLQLDQQAIKPDITETQEKEPYVLVNTDEHFNKDKYLAFNIDIKPK